MGATYPTKADAQEGRPGGVIKIAQAVMRLDDPRGRQVLQQMLDDGDELDFITPSAFHDQLQKTSSKELWN